jgi:hippurate hydrolase
MEAAAKEGKQLPGLHSPFWAPEADTVIAAGTEALVASTLELMPRK